MQRTVARVEVMDARTERPPRITLRGLLAGPGWVANALWAAAGIGLFVLVWTLIARRLGNPVLLPTPAAVIEGFYQLLADGYLVQDVLASLKRVFAGFLIAAAVGVPLAMLLAYFLPLRRLVLPLVTLLRPIPPIAWIPIAILWFGIGDKPSFFITAIAAFFPIFLNSFFGGTSAEEQHLNAARSLGAKKGSLLVRILFPSALPMIWTGLKIGLGQSWMAVVTAELIAAQSGLGYMIQTSRLNLETSYVLVGMVTIGVLGSLMGLGLSGVERYVLPWKQK
jgi:NitT/TauT family transport system permease protein